MASFLADLMNSIFTPGTTPSLIVATNASFASLQLLLAVLFIATRSVHFFVLSFLSAGLWWAINWFATEIQAAKAKEEEAERLRKLKKRQERLGSSDEETETEENSPERGPAKGTQPSQREVHDAIGELRKRRSLVDGSGELSTEDEWEKVSEGGGREP